MPTENSTRTEIVDRRPFLEAIRAQLRLDPAKTAVLAVDVHRGHLDPEVATMPVSAADARSVRAAVARLLAGARAAHVPVIYVLLTYRRTNPPGLESMVNPFWKAVEAARESMTPGRRSTIVHHNQEGSAQTELPAEIAAGPGDYVIRSKKRLSAFYGTDLDTLLRALGTETVVICGINTNTCVLCTAFDAFNRDFRVLVARDGVASMYGDDLHVLGLENVQRCLGWVLAVDEILALFGGVPAASPPAGTRPTDARPSPAR
ncbi:MAG TPA: isochorismatase family cysteine hydrolase [bacterium]|nr:isochorismatase family cysteine hydrolase [bacterium]